MSKSLPKYKKSFKILSIVYENKHGKKQNEALRSYSQLLSTHFNIMSNQKKKLKRTASSSQGFMTKRSKKIRDLQQNKPLENETQQKIKRKRLSPELSKSFQFDRTYPYNKSQTKIVINPQNQQMMKKIIMTKSSQVQFDSYKNISLNLKLQQGNLQREKLTKQIQNMRKQIASEKRTKTKVSIQLGKLMNKNEEIHALMIKTKRQRVEIESEIGQLSYVFQKQRVKNKQFEEIKEKNQNKIEIERQLIGGLESETERKRIEYSQLKTFTNELKSYCASQKKHLGKLMINHRGFADERDVFWKVVHQSVNQLSSN